MGRLDWWHDSCFGDGTALSPVPSTTPNASRSLGFSEGFFIPAEARDLAGGSDVVSTPHEASFAHALLPAAPHRRCRVSAEGEYLHRPCTEQILTRTPTLGLGSTVHNIDRLDIRSEFGLVRHLAS